MTPYDEQEVIAFQADVREAYVKADEPYRISDNAHVVWVGRMQYDAAEVGYAASRRKHLDALWRQLGIVPQRPDIPVGAPVVGQLRVVGNQFVDDRGVWPWRMVSAFDAFRLYIRGESAKLDAYAAWTRDVGARGWRVFLNWSTTGLDLRRFETLRNCLECFADYTRRQGLACEWVALCDCQRFSPAWTQAEQELIVNTIADVAVGYRHIALELANEPWNNGVDPMLFDTKRPGLLVSRGAGQDGAVYAPSLGYTTVHTRRTPEWYRYVGKDVGRDAQAITKDAVVADEPNKFEITGYTPADWERAGYNAAMFAAGMTVHGNSLTMQRCVAPHGEEDDLVRRCLTAMALVPLEAPAWQYARYGPAAPAVPMPVERDQDDDATIRLYAKVGPNDACALSLHHSAADGWVPRGANGWRVVRQTGPFVVCQR